MNKFSKLILLAVIILAQTVLAQTTGDYRSVNNGNWGTIGTWEIFNGTGWGAATAVPPVVPPYANITIQAGDTVIVEASPKRAASLKVEGTARIYANSTTNRYIRFYGPDTSYIINDGAIGSTTDGLCYGCSTSVYIYGLGTTDIARIQVMAAGVSVTTSQPITLHYAGAGLYGNNVDNVTYNVIEPGGQVTFGSSTFAGITTSTSGPSPYNATYNLDCGGFRFQPGMNFNISVRSGKKSILNIAGGLSLGDTLFAYSDSAGTEVVNINEGGGITTNGPFSDTLRFDSLNINCSGDYWPPCPGIIKSGLGLFNGICQNYPGQNLVISKNATINRGSGVLYAKPIFIDTFNLIYSGTAPCTTSYEMPRIEDNIVANLTVNHELIVDTSRIVNNVMANGGPIVSLNGYFGVLGSFNKNSTDGYVTGYMGRYVPVWGAGQDVSFFVGTSEGYAPATVHFNNVSKSGMISCMANDGEHTAAAVPQQTLKRWWNLGWRPDSIATFDNYALDLTYLLSDFNTDLLEADDEMTMVAGKYDTDWTFPAIASRDTATNTIQLSGLTSFSDFTLAKNQNSLVPDTIAPAITGTSPADGATEVARDAPIFIVFSEPMDTSSLAGSMTPSPNEQPTWNVAMDTLFLTHDSMAVNTTYTIKLTALNDLAGNPLSVLPDSFMFTTIGGDTIAPYIVSTSPADGDSGVGLNTPVVVAFSEPMDTNSLIGYAIPTDNYSVSWNAAGDTLTLTPGTPYNSGTTYSVIITAITDTVGNSLVSLPDTFITFTTIANQKPIITIVQQPVDTYDGAGPFLVRAVITDPAKAGIPYTYLYYTTGTSWTQAPAVTLPADSFSYEIPGGIPAGTVVSYYIDAVDDQGDSAYSPANAPIGVYQFRILDPLPPTGLAATAGDQLVGLSWAPPAEIIEYSNSNATGFFWDAGDIIATRFTPQHYPCKLEQVVSSWWHAIGVDSVEVHVWADDGAGLPDRSVELVPPRVVLPLDYLTYTVIDLSSENLVLSSGDFHVGYIIRTDNYPMPMCDSDGPGLRSLVYDSSASTWGNMVNSGTYHDWSHQAVVSYSNYAKGLALKSYDHGKTEKPLPALSSLKPVPLTSKLAAQYPELKGALFLAKNIAGYEVLRGDFTGGPYVSIGTPSDTIYTDNTVLNNNTYYYVVRALYASPDTFSGWSNEASATPTGVEGQPGTQSYSFFLMPASPNPVKVSAEFRFGLAKDQQASLEIYNVLGQRVKTLVKGQLAAGNHTVKWNGCDDNGRKVSSGVYVYRLIAGDNTSTRRFTVIR